MVPGLRERLLEGDENNAVIIAEMVCLLVIHIVMHIFTVLEVTKRCFQARSDDTKSLKGPILDWIILEGQSLTPPLSRNVKLDR